MFIIDTHAHYDDEKFNEDREELFSSLSSNNIGIVINSGASMQGVKDTVEYTEKYDFFYGSAGIHPTEVEELEVEGAYETLKKYALLPKIVAVGEIGLDYYWDEPDRALQKKHFEAQLELAREINKPVVIHSRDAAADTLEIMKSHRAGEMGGCIHCFSYSLEQAKEYLNMGFYLGIGGVVTFKNSRKLVEVVEYMPMDRILLETDSPYLSPEPNRGKRNSSLNLKYVVDKIAEIKNVTPEDVIKATYENANRVYKLS